MSLLDLERLYTDCGEAGLAGWPQGLDALLQQRSADGAHGNARYWRQLLDSMPAADCPRFELDQAAVTVGQCSWSEEQLNLILDALRQLKPWRKGPFDVCGVRIDSEWQSQMKWQRLIDEISPLKDRLVLDVGCGNGYYALRMRGQGARLVVGLEPTLQYVVQFLIVSHFIAAQPVHVLPVRLDESTVNIEKFDTTFSMGVLYHQRSPIDHLRQLNATLSPGGELVLETIVLPGDEAIARTPPERYARMRNVWLLPSIAELMTWLQRTGFRDIRVTDVSRTTTDEQRSTDWMTFESLANGLDPANSALTVEGWPAPHRAVIICTKS